MVLDYLLERGFLGSAALVGSGASCGVAGYALAAALMLGRERLRVPAIWEVLRVGGVWVPHVA